MANPDRKGGGGLSLQTLVIASAASVTAAMVTSRLFAHGTIYVSAVTPVIVAAVSELLHRPAARASAIRQQRRTLVHASPLSGAPEWAQGSAAEEELVSNGNGNGTHAGPVTIHGRRRWGRIHPKVAVATGLAAFAIAIAVLTLPELLFGGAVANTHRTTFFGGGTTTSQKQSEPKAQTETQTAPTTVTETVPAQAPAQQTPTQTQTTPTDTATTPTQTTPTDTGTSTTPAPSGSAPPTP